MERTLKKYQRSRKIIFLVGERERAKPFRSFYPSATSVYVAVIRIRSKDFV